MFGHPVGGVGLVVDAPATGNLLPLLHEVRHALARLVQDGTISTLDLLRLPLASQELDQLRTTLGDGEVVARLSALGESHFRETRYPGVWWVEHYNPDGVLLARSIEVTFFPALLQAQSGDVAEAAVRLAEQLAAP